MNLEISFNQNQLLINDHCISFKHSIRDAKISKDNVIVLLDIPTNDNTMDNLYSVNSHGEINWRVQSIKNIFPTEALLPYEQIVMAGEEIRSSDFYGRRYFINVDDGKIIRRDITK